MQKDTQALLRRMGEAEQKIQVQAGKLAQHVATPPPTQECNSGVEEAVEKLEEKMSHVLEQLPKMEYLIRKETRAILGPTIEAATKL